MSRRRPRARPVRPSSTLALAACGGGGASSAPSTAATAAPAASASAAAAICERDGRPGDVAVTIKDFAFDPAEITAKVGEVDRLHERRRGTHTRRRSTTAAAAPRTRRGRGRRPRLQRGRDVPLPLHDPPEDEGHDHRHRVDAGPSLGAAVGRALGDEQRGARRQVDEGRLRQPGLANQATNCSRVASAVPWYSSSSWTPAISSPWRVRNSSVVDGSGQSRTRSRPPGRSAAQAARKRGGRVGQLVERVLEVGQVVLAGLARVG